MFLAVTRENSFWFIPDVRSLEPYERAVSVFADYLDESSWA